MIERLMRLQPLIKKNYEQTTINGRLSWSVWVEFGDIPKRFDPNSSNGGVFWSIEWGQDKAEPKKFVREALTPKFLSKV
jgi:hypothetical protein